MANNKKKSWWQTKETLATIGLGLIAFSPELIEWAVESDILKDYTLVAKLALPLSILVKVLGLKKQYMMDNLPSGITKIFDKVPDKITGTKGSLPSGIRKGN